MEDSSFDKQMKSMLEEYVDTTPASVGWERFRDKYEHTAGVTGTKGWLRLSAVANILLTALVAWLLWDMGVLKERIAAIENDNASNSADKSSQITMPWPALSQVGDSLAKEHKPQAQGNVITASSPSGHVLAKKTQASNSAKKDISNPPTAYIGKVPNEVASIRIKRKALGLPLSNSFSGPSIHLAFVKLPGNENGIASGAEKTETVKLPLPTVVALEKSRMGNKIGWALDLHGGGGFSNLGQEYTGVSMKEGISIGSLLHPLWGIESGLTIEQTAASTLNSEAGTAAWLAAGGNQATGRVDEVNMRLQSIEVPLLFRFRLPVNDKRSWFASAGIAQHFLLSKRQTFYLSGDEDHEEETEDHDESIKREFRDKGFRPFYSGLVGEVGFSKQIRSMPLRWQLSAFYQHQVGKMPADLDKFSTVGLRGALRFSRW